MESVRRLLARYYDLFRNKSIQFLIAISFTLVSVVSMILVSLLLYSQFADQLRSTILQENKQLVSQIALNLNHYNASMRGISDSMYYNVIKNADLEEQDVRCQMSVLYDSNRSSLIAIACFDADGNLIATAPQSSIKPGVQPQAQDWFIKANTVIENPHFSTPHVHNLFEGDPFYNCWVISLSRMVELTHGGKTSRGVLLVEMNYSDIENIFQHMVSDTAGYVYLIDNTGEIIYHPKQKLIYSGLFNENNLQAASYSDGLHGEVYAGVGRQVIVKTVSYTGWKIVSVVPNSEFTVGFSQMKLLMAAIVGIAVFLLVLVNSLVSAWVAGPIKRLDESVRGLETGNLNLDINVAGPYEIEHLARTIRSTVDQMRQLMDDVVWEQENKRKSEFDALQAQINPHFLYNTLDSIVWMIESNRYDEAISMVTALASLFRISLSKGKVIIPILSEFKHAGYYLHIQNIRYKNKFDVKYEVDPDIFQFTTIKLIVQPLLENAIYHAMEMMDGDGVITVRGYRKEGDIYIEVQDNGLGMLEDKVALLLSGDVGPSKKGSGIGLKNVHQRIQLYYGSSYGLEIESEVDTGTTVRIHLPAVSMEDTMQQGNGEGDHG